MKRSSTGKLKEKNNMESQSDTDLFGRPIKSNGTWDAVENDLLVFTHDNCEPNEKVACFDMDGTLIETKSGKVYPVDTRDWRLLYSDLPSKMKAVHEDGYKIVIFTNQKGIQLGKVDKNLFKRKIEQIIAKLGVPIQAFLATSGGIYRKPCVGMWNSLTERNGDVEISIEKSLFVGDAAGRHKSNIRPKKDHSHADRYFALNVGLKFFTPEQFFEKKMNDEPWGPPSFDPKGLFSESLGLLEPKDTVIPGKNVEMIVMVGFPGSGKSTFSRNIAEKHGYEIVSRDILGSWQKCVARAKYILKEGKSVIIDNTNPDKESRKRYTELAKELNIPCRCFKMACHLSQAQHNIRFRGLTKEGSQEISTMVLRMHNSKYEEPELSEGFDEIVTVNFKPEFKNEEHKKLFSMFLVE